MAKPVDAVALHETHGSGVVVGPHRLATMRPHRLMERVGDTVESLVPGDLVPLPRPLGAGSSQRPGQPIRVVNALGIAGDLGADHPRRIAVVGRTPHLTD